MEGTKLAARQADVDKSLLGEFLVDRSLLIDSLLIDADEFLVDERISACMEWICIRVNL